MSDIVQRAFDDAESNAELKKYEAGANSVNEPIGGLPQYIVVGNKGLIETEAISRRALKGDELAAGTEAHRFIVHADQCGDFFSLCLEDSSKKMTGSQIGNPRQASRYAITSGHAAAFKAKLLQPGEMLYGIGKGGRAQYFCRGNFREMTVPQSGIRSVAQIPDASVLTPYEKGGRSTVPPDCPRSPYRLRHAFWTQGRRGESPGGSKRTQEGLGIVTLAVDSADIRLQ